MNGSSIIVLATLFALVALAVWRGWRKGSPCECGCNGCEKCGCCRK